MLSLKNTAKVFSAGLFGLIFSLLFASLVLLEENKALNESQETQAEIPKEKSKEKNEEKDLNEKINMLMDEFLKDYHYLAFKNIDLSGFFKKIYVLPDFIFFMVLYHKIEDLLFVENTPFYNFSLPNFPLTRFINKPGYCFRNFMGHALKTFSLSESSIAHEYRLSSKTLDVILGQFGENLWPSNYSKRDIYAEDFQIKYYGESFTQSEDFLANVKPIYTLDPRIKVFWTSTYWHKNHILGKHFSCMFQMSNHLPGNEFLALKNHFVKASRAYASVYEGKPECFSKDHLVPKSWLLQDKEECLEFFVLISRAEYQEKVKTQGPQFIRKIAASSHRGRGVEVVDAKEEAHLREIYDNGRLCGELKEPNYMIQRYISNPLTLNGHKFDFRVFLLIVSTDPFIVMFHDGFLKVSLYEYDPQSSVKAAHITSSELSKEIFKRVEEGDTSFNMTADQLRDEQLWSFERLQNHLVQKGIINRLGKGQKMEGSRGKRFDFEEDWLEEFLRPEFKKAMAHVAQIGGEYFVKNPSVFEMFGVDFMLDQNMDLWFLEANSNPEMIPTSEFKERVFHELVKETLEVILAYTRSKIKRITGFLFKLKQNILQEVSENERNVKFLVKFIEEKVNFEKVRAKLRFLLKNKLHSDHQFQNKWQIVFDYSQRDPEKIFNGLLPSHCAISS
jgi:Tubulin-tyrosine ligase family